MNVIYDSKWLLSLYFKSLKSFTKRLPFMDGHYEKYNDCKGRIQPSFLIRLMVKYYFKIN